ncbi:MAG: DNA/RNA nuclease SfsA [Asgard group archaeon]|nr:DNA/RNA nuclease SfsA [Asgard group archaeon]
MNEIKSYTVDGEITYARFINRPNRFLVNLKLEANDKIESAFLHDPGRMKELLTPNARLIIRKPINENPRKTKWDILAVELEDRLVTNNSSLPNKIIKFALENKWFEEFNQYNNIKSEVKYGHSRFDFLVSTYAEKCYIEVKGVTLVIGDKALFPDAPTTRGVRHLRELIEVKRNGDRAVILFTCMRNDPIIFSPNYETDPVFSEYLKKAFDVGVEIIIYKIKPMIKNKKLILLLDNKIDTSFKKNI